MSLFDNARSVVMNNKVVRSIKTTDGGVIYEKTDDTYLTIDVPLSLIYSDAFSITGTLTDYHGNGLSGKSVDLLVGSTVVDSTTTTTNGAYSFTSTPVRTGNHEFKVVFNGDSSYDSSESVTVSREVGKETSVIINQTNMNKTKFKPQDGNSYFEIIPKCKLVTDDNEVIANANIVVNGRTTITTNSDGEGLLAMAYSENVSFTYNGDDNYAPCSLTVSMSRQIPTVIQVTGDSVIQKEESTTLTVTVLDQDGDVIPNCTLSYSAKHGSTDVASGTLARTNNNGQTSVSYTGTGIGDVDFTFNYNANGTLLQETYTIEDCLKYIESGSNTVNGWYTIYDMGNVYEDIEISGTITFSGWQEVFALSQDSTSGLNHIALTMGDNYTKYVEYTGATAHVNLVATEWVSPVNFKIQYKDGIAKVWVNDVQKEQATLNIQPRYITHFAWNGSRTLTYSNLKIKPL